MAAEWSIGGLHEYVFKTLLGRGANLCPIWTPLWLHRKRLYEFVEGVVSGLVGRVCAERGVRVVDVLDVGCGRMPYRDLFLGDGRVRSYEGADVTPGAEVAIDAASGRIAAADAAYDVVVQFQVLEHVPDHQALLRECHRVLKPGGVMLATVPFVFEYHGVPDDYRRWSWRGIESDVVRAGFTQVRTCAIESDWESVLTVVELFAARTVGYRLGKPFFLAANLFSLLPICTKRGVLPLTIGVEAWKPSEAWK